MNLDTQLIRAEPHVEIGLLLQKNTDALIDRWCKIARDETRAAQRAHYQVLRDELPAFLDAMGRALQHAGEPKVGLRTQAKEHGEQRWDNGWSLTELVSDYQILRLVVLEFLEENLSRALYQRETLAVGVFIDDAISASIASYVDHRDLHGRTLETERVQALADLSRRKDEFLAILGHELRNPLAPIRNSLMVIRKVLSDPPPAVASSLDVMERQSAQLLRLVDDLRDLARINRGEFELRTSRFDVRRAIEQALQMTEPLINAKAHQLSVSLPDAALEIEADLSRVTQIVSNLLTNAAKYTEPGGQLSLTVEGGAREVVIRVRDNGIGIAPDMLERVFELFARVEQPEGAGPDGLGIGLSLVQRLAQQHGGTITAHSRGLGQGSEFIVRLPREGGNAALSDPSQHGRLVVAPLHTDPR